MIDPVDTKVLVTDVFNAEATFLDAAYHVSYYDAKDKITYQGKPLVWTIKNGYIPRSSDYTCEGGKQILKDWQPGDFYMGTRFLERSGMPSYANRFEYANIAG